MTTATDNAARRIFDAWTELTADAYARLASDDGMVVGGCTVWVRPSDGMIVAFRQVEDGPEEWTEIPAPTTGHRLILDDAEHTDLGPATVAQIVASSQAPDGVILVDDDGNVVQAGQFGAGQARRCWVD